MLVFKNIAFLFLLPAIAIFIIGYKKIGEQLASFRFSSTQLVKNLRPTLKLRLRGMLVYLKAISFVFIIIALARPQAPAKGAPLDLKGIDIVLAIDCSASMLAEDFNIKNERVNRLDITKKAVENFVNERKGDRIGVVAFGTHAYTACPLTTDLDWAKEMMRRLEVGITEDSTSIGYAIAASLNRLRDSTSKSKIVILLTDGRNNAGDISPQTAAEMAISLGVKIYTIGAGSKGLVPYPFSSPSGATQYRNIRIDLDEETLIQIAKKTGGKYFRATDAESLKDIYREINALEKTTTKGEKFAEYEEVFSKFLIIALCVLLLEVILKNTFLRTIP